MTEESAPAVVVTTNTSIPEMASADVLQEQPEPYRNDLAVSLLFLCVFVGAALAAAPHALAPRLPGGLVGLALFAAITFGLTIITVVSVLTWPLRRLAGDLPLLGPHLYKWGEPEPEGLLACPLCTGTWIGAVLSVLGFGAFAVTSPLDIIVHGFLAAGIVWMLYAITKKLDVY